MRRSIALTLTVLFAFALGGISPGSSAIEDVQAAGHFAYPHAARRALNAVVGRGDQYYAGAEGDPGDGNRAIGNVDRRLDRRDETIWTPAIQGAKASLLAAVVNPRDAMREKEMEDYQTDLTEALANLAHASGRPSDDRVLGVPAGAATVSGCSLPTHGPAYGAVDGRLAYVALPRGSAASIRQEMSVSRVLVDGDTSVLYTRQTERVAALCRQANLQRTRAVRPVSSRVPAPLVAVDTAPATTANSAASYTGAQARAGLAVFSANCQSCHGANLQGVAAPAVAGTEFLTTAKTDKWTLADLRNLVTENMPLNNPGTLTPEQYANVMAFLLASNCYPPGNSPFPQKDQPVFAAVPLGPVAAVQPTDPKLGVCAVK